MDLGGLASWVAAAISATRSMRMRTCACSMTKSASGRMLRHFFNAPRAHDEAVTVVNVGDGHAFRVVVTSVGWGVRSIIKDENDKRGLRNPVAFRGSGQRSKSCFWYGTTRAPRPVSGCSK